MSPTLYETLAKYVLENPLANVDETTENYMLLACHEHKEGMPTGYDEATFWETYGNPGTFANKALNRMMHLHILRLVMSKDNEYTWNDLADVIEHINPELDAPEVLSSDH